MKKLITISFALLILINSCGYFIFHSFYKHQLQSEVKSLLKNAVPLHQLERIFISYDALPNLAWTKQHKEFRYNGQMYDVVQKHSTENGVLFLCIHDFKESKLFAHLDAHIYNYVAHSPEHRSTHLKAFKLFRLVYLIPHLSKTIELYADESLGFPEYSVQYSSPECLVPKPPPKTWYFISVI